MQKLPIRKLPNGRFQADAADKRRGIPRTKRTFDTRGEAKEWLESVKRDAHNRLLGLRPRRLFGEALIKYLADLPTSQPGEEAAAERERGLARALRWPFQQDRRWVRLEQVYLDELVPAFNDWMADLRKVRARRYIGGHNYQLRPEGGDLVWYRQDEPAPGSDELPPIRVRVEDPAELRQLEGRKDDGFAAAVRDAGDTFTVRAIADAVGWDARRTRQRLNRYESRGYIGRVDGPELAWKRLREPPAPRVRGRAAFANQTIRVRQILVRKILQTAWKAWDWLDADLSGKVDLVSLPPGRETWLLPEQLDLLSQRAPDWFRRAVCGAGWIGWRKSNLLRMEWSEVIWPERDVDGNLIRRGVIFKRGAVTKNKKPLAQPMSESVEQLLRECWTHRLEGCPYVFQKDGRSIADIDFRRLWRRLKKECQLPSDLRWHDLRHTWATHLGLSGATDRKIQELGGWQSAAMVRKYTHLNVDHLVDAVDARDKYQNAARGQPMENKP